MQFKLLHILAAILLTSSFTLVASSSALAQLPDDKRAVLAFDIHVKRLLESNVGKTAELNRLDVKKIIRVHGSVSAPKSMPSEQMMMGNAPVNFEGFMAFEFESKEAADEMYLKSQIDGMEPITIDGKTFDKPTEQNQTTPRNVLHRRSSPTTIEIGTHGYLKLEKRNVFSKDLAAGWSKMPRSAVRVAIDFASCQHLIDQFVRETPGGVPFAAQPLLSIARSARVLRLGGDLSNPELLRLTATAIDAQAADQLDALLSGMLTLLKGPGQQTLERFGPEVKKPGTEMLKDLTPVRDGNNVNVIVRRPDGFAKGINVMVGELGRFSSRPPARLPPGIGPGPDASDAEREAFRRGLAEGFLEASEAK